MIENLSDALVLFLNIYNVIALAGGIAIGVVVGAIPGMTSTMAVALTLPFTFTMPPVTGILLLLGVYKGGVYGGSIPAILVRAPGTPAASCSVLDGYPLAQKGQAGRALDMALYASCFADLVSNLSLILLVGWLAALVTSFGPPENFTLIFFSLTIIASVSGDSLLRGFISAGAGLLLATVGLDLIYGTDRFTFGNSDLLGGLAFIPLLIGLFAIPEILNGYARRNETGKMASDPAGSRATWADFKSCFRSIFRGSIIGVILGAIPGIGGAPSAFVSYSEAMRRSPNRKNFGKGELEGVAAAEAGNNGVAGSTMIPLLALGIPGDVITAVILGAFMVHGLRPGPLLFEQNIDLIYALFIGISISSLFLLIIGKTAIHFFKHIASIPPSFLYPVVMILCVFGAYAVNNSYFDLYVMVAFGFLGFLMMRMHVPSAPFLIAFILGPMLEDSFRQSLLMSQGSMTIFVRSWITWIFWALTFLSVGLMIRRHLAGNAPEAALPDPDASKEERG
ncbi:tripartite tricarboxylate transporter permease [Roseovarius sp.]|uniref:tripartite tricarboxylate transporter permease n=1 Tax=Roseovarius sp. TaxID=1486281 RepID=UPI003D0F8A47